jgi:hypothetical protein
LTGGLSVTSQDVFHHALKLKRIIRIIFKTLTFILLSLTASTTAWAAVIVQVQNATITAGGTGFVDVLISSTGTDNLLLTQFDFRISGNDVNGALQFRNTADQSNSEQVVNSPSGYVFLGDTDPANWSANRQVTPTELLGGDFTASFSGVAVDGTQKLLARLEIEHVTGTPLAADGDSFTLSLWNADQGTVDPFDDSTFFLDDSFNPLVFDTDSTPNTLGSPSAFLNFGTITVMSDSAVVPEPGTFAIFTIGGIAFAGRKYRRRLGAKSPKKPDEFSSTV